MYHKLGPKSLNCQKSTTTTPNWLYATLIYRRSCVLPPPLQILLAKNQSHFSVSNKMGLIQENIWTQISYGTSMFAFCHDLASASPETADLGFIDIETASLLLLTVPCDCSAIGSSHCLECSTEISKQSEFWSLPSIGGRLCLFSIDSGTERRQTGQVDCFLSHISMHERWKLWPHLGIILRTSFSWYSDKHILHL